MIKRIVKLMISRTATIISPVRWKEYNELKSWKRKKKYEGVLKNDHYKFFYTKHFKLEDSFYENKTILDIGCGPRGSLEWADMALRRIGLDPLIEEYLKIGANQHKMEYFHSPSENIPLKNSECDVVFSFNSLDHVENIEQSISEIKRITRVGGFFLLLVEVNHPPTNCEPHKLNPRMLIESLQPEFTCEISNIYKKSGNGIYDSILKNDRFTETKIFNQIGYMSAKFVRTNTVAK